MTKDKELAGSQRTFLARTQAHVLSTGPGCPSPEVIQTDVDDDDRQKAREWSFPHLQVAKDFSAHVDSMFTVSVYRFLMDQIANEDIAQGPCLGEPCSTPLILKIQGDPVMKRSHWPLAGQGRDEPNRF